MAEREPAAGKPPAPVPSLAEPGQQLVGRENDFAHLNKQLRACLQCKLVKAAQQDDDPYGATEQLGCQVDPYSINEEKPRRVPDSLEGRGMRRVR
eukprot:gene6109-6347_t